MAKSAVELKVGVVVVIALVMFFTTIFWLKGFDLQKSYMKIDVVFPDVGGLKTGDPVSVAGVTRGKVVEIDLVDSLVMVSLQIEKNTPIYTDASFRVKNMGLMGERFVHVSTGSSGDRINSDKVFIGKTDVSSAELIGVVGETLREAQAILEEIKTTVASEENLKKVTGLVTSMTAVTGKLNTMLGENRAKIDRTASNFENMSSQLASFVDSTTTKLDGTLNNFERASTNFNKVVDSLTAVSDYLAGFLEKIERGEGSLGLLSTDETLYQDVKKMVRSLEDIIVDIRHNPKKYLNVEVEVF